MYTLIHAVLAIIWSNCALFSYNILEKEGFILLPFIIFCLCLVAFVCQAIILIDNTLNGD